MKKYFVFGLLAIAFLSCKKTYNEPRAGIFRGSYEVLGLNGGGFLSGDCTIALDDVQGKYSFNTDTTGSLYFPSSGFYNLVDGTKMDFIQKSLQNPSIDRNLYLDSTFNYIFDDTRFELTRTIDTIKYDYKFIRY
jgi:hypothetical protein